MYLQSFKNPRMKQAYEWESSLSEPSQHRAAGPKSTCSKHIISNVSSSTPLTEEHNALLSNEGVEKYNQGMRLWALWMQVWGNWTNNRIGGRESVDELDKSELPKQSAIL